LRIFGEGIEDITALHYLPKSGSKLQMLIDETGIKKIKTQDFHEALLTVLVEQ